MEAKFEKHIRLRGSLTALDCLSEETDLSRQQLKHVMQNGAVWLESARGISRLRRAKKVLTEGDQLHLYYDAEIQKKQPPEAELIADEGDYSIWNKPSGMYSQGTKWGDHFTIYRWAEQHLSPQRTAFIVHRLDRAANGLILVAHKKSVAAMFSKMFEQREIYKKYHATVEGLIADIEVPHEIDNELDGKRSISEIVSIARNGAENTTDVEVVIKTGRKHQIRRHLSGLGYPIVGDRLYGSPNTAQDLQLSAVHMRFICPVSGNEKSYCLGN